MYGLEYHRRKRHLTQRELAQMSHVGVGAIWKIEKVMSLTISVNTYAALAAALDITVDELMAKYPDYAFWDEGGRTYRPSRAENPNNCLTVYRKAHQLSFLTLAQRFGNTTKESGRIACVQARPLDKHVRALADYEGISEAEFLTRYRSDPPAA